MRLAADFSLRYRLHPLAHSFWLWLLLAAPVGRPEAQSPAAVNFAYATVLGTGVYQAGERRVYVLNMPFHRTLRTPSGDRPGLGFNLGFPF